MTALLFLGLAIVLIGGLMLLVAAFRVSIWWGIFCLVFSPVQLVFIFKYWEESKSAIMMQVVGILVLVAALLMGGASGPLQQILQPASQGVSSSGAVQSSDALQDIAANIRNGVAGLQRSVSNSSGDENTAGAAQAPSNVTEKTIYKCVDARGRVAYTEQPCVGRQDKAIDVKVTDESIWDKL